MCGPENILLCNLREPSRIFNRQIIQGRKLHRAAASVLCCCLIPLAGFASPVPCTNGMASAAQDERLASVAKLMHYGHYRDASLKIESALRESPDNQDLQLTAGLCSLALGDRSTAAQVFSNIERIAPDSSIAEYGLGLCSLAGGDLTAADGKFAAALKLGGDPEVIALARSYIVWLRGGLSVSIGKSVRTGAVALQAMTLIRQGAAEAGAVQMQHAFDTAEGDPFVQSDAPIMSFDVQRPLLESREPQKHQGTKSESVTGDVTLSPEDAPASAAYASYELDGAPLSIVGSKPFTYTWDSTRARNGLHEVSIVLYDRSGIEISRAVRKINVANRIDVGANIDEGRSRVRAEDQSLWSLFVLKPDRARCADAVANVRRKQGDERAGRTWFTRAAAIDPTRPGIVAKAAGDRVPAESRAFYSGRADVQTVALTFDDGPKPGITEPLLELLTTEKVPATFFVIGKHMQEFPDLARSIAAAGMEIANHSYTHRSLTSLTIAEAQQEMLQTQAAVMTLTGKRPVFVRPPGGNWNNQVAEAARQIGLTPCMWSVDVFDSEIISAQKVTEAVLTQVKPGAIVLMHNGKLSTLQALPTIIKTLRQRGYRFVTVSELASKAGNVHSAATGRIGTHSE